MKRLFVFTTTFPFGVKEPFIESELEYYTPFDEVYFMPLYKEGEIRNIPYPPNVKWIPLNSFKINKLKIDCRFIAVLFKRIFYQEIRLLAISHKFSLRNLYNLCLMLVRADYYTRQIYREIKRRRLHLGADLYFYSYWMMEHAMTSLLLSKKITTRITFTRAHGYDLYENRNLGHYLACREFMINNLDTIYPVSLNGVKYLKNKYRGGKIEVARLGTRDYGLAPFAFNYNMSRKLTIVSCSWCSEVKRIDLLIKALSCIKVIDISWIHFGDGPLFEDLQQMSKNILSRNVLYRFAGRMSNKEIIDFYKSNNVDLFVNVSSSEGIPVSIMEAISFGIPVIATAVGGIPEIVQDGLNGYLLNQDVKPEELSLKIESFAEMSVNEIQIMRANARKYWEQNYSASENYACFFKLIAEN